MTSIRNIAAYKFAPLSNLKELREQLLRQCKSWGLKGTILLSTEGINLFVAGDPDNIELLVAELRLVKGLEELQVKVSASDHQPFNRMLVRIKKEIIAFGVEGIDPARKPAPKISPQTLKQWLDEGREITLLDTRNDYEVRLGTFKNALPVGIDHFRDFPHAVRQKLSPDLKEKPIVMFCTGGIRCEKAGPFMEQEGFKYIFQLDGGILKYFEECGGAYYDGECFVFDQRVGLDPTLRETETDQCFNCLSPLTPEEQEDSRYIAGKSCPYCFRPTAEERALNLKRRQEQIHRVLSPLPGCTPYDNFRPMSVPQECESFTLAEFLRTILPHIAEDEWSQLASQGKLLDRQHQPVALTHLVRAGERYYQKLPQIIEPAVNAQIELLHEDEALIVINKPAPLPMHPGGRFNRNTLQYFLNLIYYPQKPKPAHRLDANTTGLLLVTRTRHFAARLQPQFARGEVKKTYLVRVQGTPTEDFFISEAPISDSPGELGSRTIDQDHGLPSRTEFRVLHRREDGTTLMEATPLTGRTNQIRVHLWELGYPVCGDTVYLPGGKLGETHTLAVDESPLCLHAWKIVFMHPMTSQKVVFTAPPPEWAAEG